MLRFLFRLALVAATTAAGVAFSTAASASVTYDPVTMTGFVGRADVRKAFGWTNDMLAARAPEVVFDHEFWTDDTYSVSCGRKAFPIVHHREYGSFQLAGERARRERSARAAYHGRLTGFRLAGATSGISGTSVPPMVGQPCPRLRPASATIDKVHLVSSATGWALAVNFHDVRRELLAP